jgi:hypothetical protein
MFENFCEFFNIKQPIVKKSTQHTYKVLDELIGTFGGCSFKKGIYRIHAFDDINTWNENVAQAFPDYNGKIVCFGYDWLGRQFALDRIALENGQDQVLMFEPGTAEVLSIPCSIENFHEEEIPQYHDSCLASDFFEEWILSNPAGLKNNECAGYKIMLFLGGADAIQNLEISDMHVYWSVCSQIIQKLKTLQ